MFAQAKKNNYLFITNKKFYIFSFFVYFSCLFIFHHLKMTEQKLKHKDDYIKTAKLFKVRSVKPELPVDKWDCELTGTENLRIYGPSGSGKTTFLKNLLNKNRDKYGYVYIVGSAKPEWEDYANKDDFFDSFDNIPLNILFEKGELPTLIIFESFPTITFKEHVIFNFFERAKEFNISIWVQTQYLSSIPRETLKDFTISCFMGYNPHIVSRTEINRLSYIREDLLEKHTKDYNCLILKGTHYDGSYYTYRVDSEKKDMELIKEKLQELCTLLQKM